MKESCYVMKCDVCGFTEVVPSYRSSYNEENIEKWKHLREWNSFEMNGKKIDVCSKKCLLAHIQGFEKGFKESRNEA